MIRILHKVHSMDAGGMQSFIMNVYRQIDRNKIQFDFLVSETDKEGYFDREIFNLGGRVYSVPSRRQGVIKSINGLNRFFKEHSEYKILHAHLSSLTDVNSLKIAKKHGIPCRIVHSHSTRQGGGRIHKYLHHWNQQFLQSYATDYLACSNSAAKWMYSNEIYGNHKYKLINNGIQSSNFTFNKSVRDQMREEMDISDKFVVGHVGRFNQVKNHFFLLDIFKKIHKKNTNSVLLFVGDGELRNDVEKKVEEMGLSANVIFTGVRSDIARLLQVMDVFVLPSLYEGLPVVLIEAQASGLKCFTSKDVVTSEVNLHGLVEFINLNEPAKFWANKILDYMEYIRMDTNEIILEKGYDISLVSKELEEWYLLKNNASEINNN